VYRNEVQGLLQFYSEQYGGYFPIYALMGQLFGERSTTYGVALELIKRAKDNRIFPFGITEEGELVTNIQCVHFVCNHLNHDTARKVLVVIKAKFKK
jgi:hypothetical protein